NAIIQYIEKPCVKLSVYLLYLGYKTTASNAFGEGIEHGVWFKYEGEKTSLCATFTGKVLRNVPQTVWYNNKTIGPKEELSEKEIKQLGLDFTELHPHPEDYKTSHIQKNDLQEIIQLIEAKVAKQNSVNEDKTVPCILKP